ncbi:DUF2087 domain-containing protein [Caproiciproducens sp. NJN-50]|uniref:DUF2087 domain-containing protein n=1 Tax=Caproiciproducens sp. NJN-50 TaxID=2507162 RepID=UPI000FFDFD5F|nr:DUF2087 domain-containing protein [Caproiciproducens sp. NJN-50]QAT51118.1 DUF2087 domain-containing protein [Caproiciproducens sp. NJN-50]
MDESTLTPEQKQEEKIIRSFFSSTAPLKLKTLPSKQQKLQVVLKRVAEAFESGKTYSEQEVKELLAGIYADHATLRRSLIDFGYLKRTSNGASYWREAAE